jgi:predicted metal-dependent hydrolase
MSEPVWPYTVRVSKRARRATIRIDWSRGLEVVIPSWYRKALVPDILARHRRWIERTMARMAQLRQADGFVGVEAVPAQVSLPALGETWRIVAGQSQETPFSVNTGLVIPVNDPANWEEPLRAWLVQRAQEILPSWLADVSRLAGLNYERVSVRLQRSRWGSCSTRKMISLNARLLFVRPKLVEYVFLHELCHTRQMNHSQRFWSLLERHCPGARRLDRELTIAGRSLPRWAYRPRR